MRRPRGGNGAQLGATKDSERPNPPKLPAVGDRISTLRATTAYVSNELSEIDKRANIILGGSEVIILDIHPSKNSHLVEPDRWLLNRTPNTSVAPAVAGYALTTHSACGPTKIWRRHPLPQERFHTFSPT